METVTALMFLTLITALLALLLWIGVLRSRINSLTLRLSWAEQDRDDARKRATEARERERAGMEKQAAHLTELTNQMRTLRSDMEGAAR